MREREEGCRSGPLGVVLAGGLGRRLGGDKAVAELAGRPLISYPVEAMRAALPEVVVIAKADTRIPPLSGVGLWNEPATPRHPVAGIMAALRFAAGRPVFVCAGDLPFVTPALISRIAAADAGGAPAVVAARGAEMQPLLGVYRPPAGELLRYSDRPLRELVAAIGPRLVEVEDPEALFNVNTPADLLRAAEMLGRRGASRR